MMVIMIIMMINFVDENIDDYDNCDDDNDLKIMFSFLFVLKYMSLIANGSQVK